MAINSLASWFIIWYICEIQPMMTKFQNQMQIFNEVVLLTCFWLMALFTDYVQDPVDRYRIGWNYLGFLGLIIVINVYAEGENFRDLARDLWLTKKKETKVRDQRIKELKNELHSLGVSKLAFKSTRQSAMNSLKETVLPKNLFSLVNE